MYILSYSTPHQLFISAFRSLYRQIAVLLAHIRNCSLQWQTRESAAGWMPFKEEKLISRTKMVRAALSDRRLGKLHVVQPIG